MQARFCSCVGLGVGVWLLTYPTTPAFYLSSTHFLTTLHTCFGLSHPIVTHFSRCQCGHTIDDLSIHLLRCPYESEHTKPMIHFRILLQLMFWRLEHMFNGRSPTFSFATPNNEWISLSLETTFEPWWMLS
jgi:hypothetical protein